MTTEQEARINKEQKGCPFYGFASIFGGLWYQEGSNQCPFRSGHSPCMMEAQQGRFPNLRECSLYHGENSATKGDRMHLKNNLDTITVSHDSREEGYSLRQWLTTCGFTEADLV